MARILVAEDDAHMMRLMSMWLERNGHEVCEARNGEEAKLQLASSGFDCAVTDVNMPRLSGIELIRWMRDEGDLDIPVIVLSARCDQVRIGESLAGYRVSFHPKPFSPSRLLSEIESLLSPTQAP